MIKVLLVDDQQILAEGIKSVLETSGDLSVVGFASDGARAIEKCAETKPDVVLMDIRMPVITGYEAARQIRQLERGDAELPIIAMTADAFSEDVKKCKECGMNDHTSKPIDMDVLTRLLAKYLHRS